LSAKVIEPTNGLVIRYSYLWAREYDRREMSGRKDRPVCVQIILRDARSATIVALFPITSQPPGSDRTALELPEIETRRARLQRPAWIILDEWNLDDLSVSPHVANARPLGTLSSAFMRRVREAAAARIRAGRYRSIPRS
jgi:hypothetical protein